MFDGYLDSMSQASDEVLLRIEDDARVKGIPIVGRRTAALIQVLVRVARPSLVVELGTATGYSGIWLLRGWPDAHLITYEVDDDRAAQASRNFAEAGLAERADVRVGNAVEGLESLDAGSVAVIFNDLLNGLRDLERVERCYRGALRALGPGGLLLADNALAGGDVLRQETHEGRCVHRWNALVLDDPSVFGLIVPTDDGLSVAVRATHPAGA
jgi:predicted O-methyltransferase YrrM